MPVDAQIFALGPTRRLQALPKGRRTRLSFRIILRIVHQHYDLAHPVGLLCTRRDRPCGRPATKQRDELAALHSRTSLARAMNTSNKETPIEAAVLRLMAM